MSPSSSSPRFSAILFDLDGTLVDSLRDLQEAVNYALKRFNFEPLGPATVRAYVGDGLRVLLARAYLGKESATVPVSIDDLLEHGNTQQNPTLDEMVEAFQDFYGDHLTDHTRCYSGVEETLSRLAENGMPLGVVSNKPKGYTATILSQLGIGHYFATVVGGDTVAAIKPDPTPVVFAIEKLQSAAEKTLMVGDSANDLIAGKRAGCQTAGVTYGFSSRHALTDCEPDYVLDSLEELMEVV